MAVRVLMPRGAVPYTRGAGQLQSFTTSSTTAWVKVADGPVSLVAVQVNTSYKLDIGIGTPTTAPSSAFLSVTAPSTDIIVVPVLLHIPSGSALYFRLNTTGTNARYMLA